MKNQFIKITYITLDGCEWDLIVNVNEIARLLYGCNHIEFRTPFQNGFNYVNVSPQEFNRLEKILLEEE